MDVRETLIDLITASGACFTCFPVGDYDKEEKEKIADYLIAHGVTVQQWIPVTERLPDKELWEYQKKYDQDNMEVLVMIKGAKEATTLYYDNDGDFNDENGESWLVTHWQPMLTPPKEEPHGE